MSLYCPVVLSCLRLPDQILSWYWLAIPIMDTPFYWTLQLINNIGFSCHAGLYHKNKWLHKDRTGVDTTFLGAKGKDIFICEYLVALIINQNQAVLSADEWNQAPQVTAPLTWLNDVYMIRGVIIRSVSLSFLSNRVTFKTSLTS